jgi:hypothetical protein
MLYEDFVEVGLAFILPLDVVLEHIVSFFTPIMDGEVGEKEGRPILDILLTRRKGVIRCGAVSSTQLLNAWYESGCFVGRGYFVESGFERGIYPSLIP